MPKQLTDRDELILYDARTQARAGEWNKSTFEIDMEYTIHDHSAPIPALCDHTFEIAAMRNAIGELRAINKRLSDELADCK